MPIELVSKALHKNKAFTRIRLFCGGDQLMKQRFNYGLGLKRASPNSMKAFFCHFLKNFVIFLLLILFVWC
ncbi:hypothetical protein [Helicobacter pylori]|uniref:hypothetical protein n=1 Tax=Helicobacter pylori TaxID=210 RepID=UPI001FD0A5E6|nr:hypothetical protein [Helicobacter pylori]UOR63209.1 hypothetical protein MPG55_05575 [Helicobacter pylori]